MNQNSTLMNIIKFVGFILIAGLALRVFFAILGGMFFIAIRFGIPLLIAIAVVRWLTARQPRSRRHY